MVEDGAIFIPANIAHTVKNTHKRVVINSLLHDDNYDGFQCYEMKLEELRILLGKFSSPQNAYVILELAKYNLRQGDV